MTAVIEQVDFVLLEDAFDEEQCQSTLMSHQHAHPAIWYAVAPCMDITPVCEARRRQCFAQGGWMCIIRDGAGCTGWHEYEHLTFTPVRGS